MLIGSFCHIIEAESNGKENNGKGIVAEREMENGTGSEAEERQFRVGINGEHPIYLGHFFGNPITPGACLVEIAEELIGRPITQIKGLKFLNTVPPTAELVYTFSPKQENQYTVTITDYARHNTYARFNATYLCGDTDL